MTLDFVFKTCTGHDCAYWSERGDLDWFDKYADPRHDSGKGVLTANWNNFPRNPESARYSNSVESRQVIQSAQEYNWSAKGREFQDILERMGYNLEWNDQTSRCDHCYGCITEGPDYYGDTSHSAILGDCDTVCEDCIRKDFAAEYLEGLENNPRTACHISGVNPADHGYLEIECGFENGWHPGQNDDPRKIYKELTKRGYDRIIFEISSSGQFDVHFCVWAKETPVTALGINEYTGIPVPYESLAIPARS